MVHSRIPDRYIVFVSIGLWSMAALAIGLVIGAAVLPQVLERTEVRMDLPETILDRAMPRGEIRARDILAGPHPRTVEKAAVRTVKQCLAGRLIPDLPNVRASHYPWNRCACLAAESVTRFTSEELRQLEATFKRAATPPFRLRARWHRVVVACQGLPGTRVLPPRTPATNTPNRNDVN
mgnify:CR=1 FL=1